ARLEVEPRARRDVPLRELRGEAPGVAGRLADAAGAEAARAVGAGRAALAVGARRAGGAAAVDVGLLPVLDPVAAGGRLADAAGARDAGGADVAAGAAVVHVRGEAQAGSAAVARAGRAGAGRLDLGDAHRDVGDGARLDDLRVVLEVHRVARGGADQGLERGG